MMYKSNSLLNSRVARWNEEKLGGNLLQRILETSLEDSWRKVYAIYSKQFDHFCGLHALDGILARSFSIIRSRVSLGLVPVHFYM